MCMHVLLFHYNILMWKKDFSSFRNSDKKGHPCTLTLTTTTTTWNSDWRNGNYREMNQHEVRQMGGVGETFLDQSICSPDPHSSYPCGQTLLLTHLIWMRTSSFTDMTKQSQKMLKCLRVSYHYCPWTNM